MRPTLYITWRIFAFHLVFKLWTQGTHLLLPFILAKKNKTAISMLCGILGQFPSILITYFIIDTKTFGRKKSLIIFLIAFLISNMVTDGFLYGEDFDLFTYIIALNNFFQKCSD